MCHCFVHNEQGILAPCLYAPPHLGRLDQGILAPCFYAILDFWAHWPSGPDFRAHWPSGPPLLLRCLVRLGLPPGNVGCSLLTRSSWAGKVHVGERWKVSTDAFPDRLLHSLCTTCAQWHGLVPGFCPSWRHHYAMNTLHMHTYTTRNLKEWIDTLIS